VTLAATAIAAVFSWLIAAAAWAAFAVAVDDPDADADADELGVDEDAGELVDDDPPELHALAPTAKPTARMPVRLIVARRPIAVREVFIIEPLSCWCFSVT
jgi:hypothetical protein